MMARTSFDSFDAELFGELVETIIVESNERIRFRLKNGLELVRNHRKDGALMAIGSSRLATGWLWAKLPSIRRNQSW